MSRAPEDICELIAVADRDILQIIVATGRTISSYPDGLLITKAYSLGLLQYWGDRPSVLHPGKRIWAYKLTERGRQLRGSFP